MSPHISMLKGNFPTKCTFEIRLSFWAIDFSNELQYVLSGNSVTLRSCKTIGDRKDDACLRLHGLKSSSPYVAISDMPSICFDSGSL